MNKNQLNSKKCKFCRREFQPKKLMQSVCGLECAQSLVFLKREKEQRKETAKQRREDKIKLEQYKTIGRLKSEAQTAFNRFIRERDKLAPCISCGRFPEEQDLGGTFDAGHYRSRGSADHLRYEELNVHKQCKQCNRYKDGNVQAYRIGLIERIGIEKVEWLERRTEIVKWSRAGLIAIKNEYNEKYKELKRSKDGE